MGLKTRMVKEIVHAAKTKKKNFLKYFEYFNTMLKIRKGVGLTKNF